MNPYFQYFGGIDILRWGQPCAATDLVHFRNRIGEEGKVLAQEQHSKNKIYSLHEPDVYCVAKGKAHKKYEYGCKGSVVLTQTLTGTTLKQATVDRGYKGTQKVESTSIIRPSKLLKGDNAYQKQKKRKHCRRRAAIEPIIGHIKKDHRAALNYLKGKAGDQVNFAMAASGFNYRKLMRKLRAIALWLYTKLVSNRKCQLELKSIIQFDLISPPKMSF